MVAAVLAATVCAGGCGEDSEGSPAQSEEAPDDPGAGAGAQGTVEGTAGLGGMAGMDGTGEVPLPPATGRRLTSSEYVRSVSDLFEQDFSAALELLPEDAAPNGFRNDRASLLPSAARTFAIEEVAWFVADNVEFSTLSAVAPCVDATADCQRGFVEELGLFVFRRPLTTSEVDRWSAMFEVAAAEGEGFEQGARLVVAGLLQSPYFQYRLERLAGSADAAGYRQVGNYAMATRLSYLLWGSTPDAALLERASQGLGLDEVGAAVDEMLTVPGAEVGQAAFVEDWLSLYRLDSMNRDPEVFPEYSSELIPVLKHEVQELFRRVSFGEGADLRRVFTDTSSALHPSLAPLYGLTPEEVEAQSDDGLFDVSVVPNRGGVLSMPGLIAAQSSDDRGSIVERGLFVLRVLTCQDVPPPPPGVASNLEAVPLDLPQRERLLQHTTEPACRGCHGQFDPFGYAFEPYDGLGRFHEIDAYGNEIRGDGEFELDGVSHQFENLREFQALLADSETVRTCIARKFLQYAYGRELDVRDEQLASSAAQAFADGGNTYTALVRAVATDPLFGKVVDTEEGEMP